MKILGMDVCTGFCSVAVVDGNRMIAAQHEAMARGHVERLAPMVAEVLAEAGMVPDDLDGIAVTTGPGSFTGARLGVSFARGLALAARIPAVGVSVFEAIQESLETKAVIALPGKNGSVLLQRFAADGTPQTSPAEFDPDTAVQIIAGPDPLTVAGPAADHFLKMLPQEVCKSVKHTALTEVTAETIARLGAAKLAKGESPVPAPLYVRPADAKPQAAVNLS